ncbi:Putative sterol carrier protein [hydrothermal vent metagenome]|uniref:Sterol carrier protein n=1 Tax=hydrothermal vent metagenome TaxID=652676 RepID=A0A3B0SU81_9ZZZZ
MTDVIAAYVENPGPKVRGILRGTAKPVITDAGTVMLDDAGARAGDEPADVTLMAGDAVFREILFGDQNPVTAFMSRKLKVEGSVQRALKVSASSPVEPLISPLRGCLVSSGPKYPRRRLRNTNQARQGRLCHATPAPTMPTIS